VISFRFLGPWPLSVGITVGLALAILTGRYYRKRLRTDPLTPIRRLVPWLRGAVVFLLVMMWTGPVMHRRRVIGELARVVVVLDASRSMELPDPRMADHRKARLAERLGHLAPGTMDESGYVAMTELRAAAEIAAAIEGLPPAGAEARRRLEELARAVEGASAAFSRLRPETLADFTLPGRVFYERWDDLSGSPLADLSRDTAFRAPPSEVIALDRLEYRPATHRDRYGGRLRGYLYPPESGNYVFWIAGDDACELKLSTDDRPENARRVAHVPTWTSPGEWEKHASQRSAEIFLRAGQRYYFEVLHREDIGEDHVAVGWQRPSGGVERPIDGAHIAPFTSDPQFQPCRLFESQWVQPVRAALASYDDDPVAGALAIGSLGRLAAQWDNSLRAALDRQARRKAAEDPSWAAALDTVGRLPRWERVRELLLGGRPPLARALGDRHEVGLYLLRNRGLESAWMSAAGVPETGLRELLPQAPDGIETDFLPALEAVAQSRGTDGRATALVLVSDGVHNAESSPVETARALGAEGIPIYPVLVGDERPPPDIAMAEIEAPRLVHYKDRVRGAVELRDGLTPGQPFRLSATCDGQTLWAQELSSEGMGQRRVTFDFPIEEMVSGRMSPSDLNQRRAVAMTIEFRLDPPEEDAESRNNRRLYHFLAMTRENRVLLVDDRPRWEWRYLRHLFERDPAWRAQTLIRGPDGVLPRGGGQKEGFPPSREDLFAYDLIILGDVPATAFRAEEMDWIRDFVGVRGGGLIVVDGPRGHLRGFAGGPLDPLFPVDLSTDEEPERVTGLRRTPAGASMAAFDLGPAEEAADPAWKQLPPPRWMAAVTARPGTETLVEGVSGSRSCPAIVLRRFGAGRVLYLAFDETWRWRYRVEDRYHRRFWNQVALWMMEAPFAASNDFATLDADAFEYPADARVRVRARLRDAQGRPRTDATAWLDLYREGRRVAVVPLVADSSGSGVYRAETEPLEVGEYAARLRVLNEPEPDPPLAVEFHVRSPGEKEWVALAADGRLMRQMAAVSGGRTLGEEEADSLLSVLEPLSRGRVIESDVVLWQTYGWLFLAAGLLTIEWILRKWEGMA